MKMFKKLMAVALVGVMALSMLTGCAVTDKIVENKVGDALEALVGHNVTFKATENKDYKNTGDAVKTAMKAAIKADKEKKDYKTADAYLAAATVTAKVDTSKYIVITAKYSTSKDTIQKSLTDTEKAALTAGLKDDTKAKYYVSDSFSAPEETGKDKTCDWVVVVIEKTKG